MPRPRTPDEIKKSRGTYRKPLIEGCPHALRRKKKARSAAIAGRISGEILELFEEAVDEIEENTPHVDDSHGMPDEESLRYVETISDAVNPHLPADLHLKSAHLFRLILDAARSKTTDLPLGNSRAADLPARAVGSHSRWITEPHTAE
jgi:hypothetical protein